MNRRHWPALLAALFPLGATAAQTPSVEVRVLAEHRGGDLVYRYTVVNRGTQPIERLLIGCDCRTGAAIGQVMRPPSGGTWSESGDRLDVPVEVLGAPAGWRGSVNLGFRDSYYLSWRAVNPRAALPPGQVLEGFSVAVPGDEPALLTGDFTAVWHAAAGYTGPLALHDLEPPVLKVGVEARETPEGYTTVATRLDVNDNVDPYPRVWLESFAREEPAGSGTEARYTLTYRAADASGNQARASTVLRLPEPPGAGLPAQAFLP